METGSWDLTIWLSASIVLYILVAVAVLSRAIIVKGATLIDPIVHFVLFTSLFTLPLAIRLLFTYEIEGGVSKFLFDFIGYMPISVFFCACALVVFYLAYYSSIPDRLVNVLPVIRTPSAPGACFASTTIFGIAFLLLSILASAHGGLLQFILLGYGGSSESVGYGYLAAGFPWLFVATMFIFVAYAISRSKLLFLIGAFALFANLAMNLIMGNRTMMLYIMICFGTFFLVQIRYLRGRTIVLLGLTAFILLNIVGMTRKSNYDSVDSFIESTMKGGTATLSDTASGMFYTLTIGEFVVPFETLPQMVRVVGTEIEPWWGWSYLRSPAFFVPSAIFPSRPTALPNWYMEQFYGQAGNLNEGRQFFFLAEGYLNFGPIGIILTAAVWGIGWRTFFKWLRRCRFDPGATMIYALGLAYMFRCISGTWVTFVSGFTQQSLAIAVIGLLVAGVKVRIIPAHHSSAVTA